ncbi:MAG: hypothetical protein WCK82_12420 [Bacteroidota bacterium]|jgi:hypothetical protein
MKTKHLIKVFIVFVVLSVLYSSCHQRYWFRSKVNSEKDSGTVEKSYQIAW